MAVEMVRKPSETPNIENVDDFMPIRYAYANQNGYVIGRGRIGTGIDTEAYTINGNTFTINSGRLVIQGVECDIDTGHSVVIDINSTKRYCAIYLEVNLATNTSDIFVAYDMLGTPSVDAGDDLTANKIGTARMVLFTCEATNGLISNVIKVVKACEYSIPFRLDENGVLKYGDIIIPQEKLLWEGRSISAGDYEETINFNEEIKNGDILEVCYQYATYETIKYVRFKVDFTQQNGFDFVRIADGAVYSNLLVEYGATISVYPTHIKHSGCNRAEIIGGNIEGGLYLSINSVHKVIR